MPIKLKNNVFSTLASAISASDVGLTVATGTGALFPALATGDYFYATLISTGGTQEIVKVTARASDAMTIVRAQDGTTAQSFAVGSRIELRVTAAAVTDFSANGTGAVVRSTADRLREFVSVKDFGAVGDGTTDDTAAIQAALNTSAKEIYFPEGRYRIYNVANDSNPTISSAVADRLIHGPGIITASTQVKRALRVTGNNTVIDGLQIDGNNNIGYAIEIIAENPVVANCYIHDLNGFTNWGGVAIRLDFDSLDTTALIANNTIKNLQGVGDGVGGNGVGMQRAVMHETNQTCTNTIFVIGNNIEDVMGEEGDAIVFAETTGSPPLRISAVIANNSINGWSRRAVKIQASGVTVSNNFFTNNLSAPLASLQRVIDVTDGSNITVTGNIFSRCKYQSQIAVFLNSPQTGNDYIISNNTIEGVEATSASALIVLRTYGNRVVVQNNTILCPAHPTQAIEVFNTATVFICGNTIDTDNDTWYDFTNSTNVQIANNTGATSINYQQYFDLTNNEFVFDATAGRAVTLYQRDATLSDGEIIAELKCRQNDTSFPDTVMASVGFVAEGSTGSTAVAIYTGSGASPKQERVRVTSAGALRPTTDNSSALTLGTAAFRWSYVHAFVVRTHGLTVATLPTAATAGAGARAFVTDANATTFASVVAGGGANGVPVYSDGTNWRIG